MGIWLVVHGISIIFIVLLFLPFFVLLLPELIVAYIALIAFYSYCYMAVYSLYENIKEKSHREKVAKALAADSLVPTTNDIPKKTQIEIV